MERHGKITLDYVKYNVNDTLATYDLYGKMIGRLAEFNLDIAPERAFSPASLGKAYLAKMGIKSFSEKNPDFPAEILGYVMTTYYGGRAEVRIRKTPTRVRLMDFKSMYPSLYVLMDLWKFLTAEKIVYYDLTEEVKKLVSDIALNSLTNPFLYPRLVTIVKILPDRDVLPVRANYGDDKNVYNIGINYLTSRTPLWYALPDVIASKLLTGKTPKILEAISFRPKGMQHGLLQVTIPGGYVVEPEEDLIRRLVESREELKKKRDETQKDTPEYGRLDIIQNELKILANATSYGIFIEIKTEDPPTKTLVYGLKTLSTKADKSEEFGRFFNPIVATILSSGARLMLAMAEAWLDQHGGYYAFCDTDSMAVSPRHWKPLQAFFQSLNPYKSSEPLLEMEHAERNENRDLLDLWFYGISAKRYVLYRIADGKSVIVKEGWSSHGLGHLLHSGREDEDTRDKWEMELWTSIIKVANGQMIEEELCENYASEYAVSKYTVTKPNLHRRLQAINHNKDISKQIKPYNFVLIGQPSELSDTGEAIHPVTKFTKNADEAPYQPFIDYNTGKRCTHGTQLYWKDLSATIKEYLNHPESKFKNGSETGKMKRRHIYIADESQITYIGKEANEIEETEILGVSEHSYIKYR